MDVVTSKSSKPTLKKASILKLLFLLVKTNLFYKPVVSVMTIKSVCDDYQISLTFVSSGKWVVNGVCI